MTVVISCAICGSEHKSFVSLVKHLKFQQNYPTALLNNGQTEKQTVKNNAS
jgi:hypothetical protein